MIQYNEYYPFGLQASTSWTRENHKNNYLYNAGNELNENNGLYETFFRGYDPALGRFLQVDPLASMYGSHSGYNYALNNPVLFNDPMGDRVISELPDYADQSVWDGGGYRRNGPGSGNHWTDQYSSGNGMGAGDFINSALRSENGGSWNYGSYHYYTSSEARSISNSYRFENYAYLDYSTAGPNTGPTTVVGQRLVSERQQGDPYPTDKYYQLPDEPSRERFGAFEYFWSGGIENGIKYDRQGRPMYAVTMGVAPDFIGGPLRKGQQALKLGKYLFNPTAFHAVKQDFLKMVGSKQFIHIVGNNPDIMFKGTKVFLSGAKNSPYFGKSFSTSFSVFDFINLF